MLPNPAVSLFNDSVFVITPNKNYTGADYKDLFTNLDYSIGYTMYEGVENSNKGFPAPGVPTYCYWGNETDTPLTYKYSENFPDGAEHDLTIVNTTDGDGTVNTDASKVCLQWKDDVKDSGGFKHVEHGDMVKNITVLEAIAKVVILGVGSGPRSHPKPSADNRYMEGIFNPMTSRNSRVYNEIQKMIGKMMNMARSNNYYRH